MRFYEYQFFLGKKKVGKTVCTPAAAYPRSLWKHLGYHFYQSEGKCTSDFVFCCKSTIIFYNMQVFCHKSDKNIPKIDRFTYNLPFFQHFYLTLTLPS